MSSEIPLFHRLSCKICHQLIPASCVFWGPPRRYVHPIWAEKLSNVHVIIRRKIILDNEEIDRYFCISMHTYYWNTHNVSTKTIKERIIMLHAVRASIIKLNPVRNLFWLRYHFNCSLSDYPRLHDDEYINTRTAMKSKSLLRCKNLLEFSKPPNT